jgi:sulfate adenylyltransferase large subunit
MHGTVAFELEPTAGPDVAPSSLLRFITCGSVDDGKSTLLGRLLYEGSRIPQDQLEALSAESKRYGSQGAAPDFALLVDGLAAEREQGITIDVAYRYFSTPRRKFIAADTPGHEQYTRNMATGASTADLAVLLVDARKGLLPQTRRHSLIVSMLGVRHVIVAVNKMDLVGFAQLTFARIEKDYHAFAANLGFSSIICIPVSATAGDNIVSPRLNMTWYRGRTLLEHLETVDVTSRAREAPFRMPVQLVNRPNSEFRGFSGLVTSGSIRPGDWVRVHPSGFKTQVGRVVTADGDLAEAIQGQSVTLTLVDEADVARGDMIAALVAPPTVSDRIKARLLWVSEEPLAAGCSYLLKAGTGSAIATIATPGARIDIATGCAENVMTPGRSLELNEIGLAAITLDRLLAFDIYEASADTGGFILIDRTTNQTVAMGLIEGLSGETSKPAKLNSAFAELRRGVMKRERGIEWLEHAHEKPWRSLAKAVTWRTTGSVDTFLLALLFTGNTRLSVAISGTEILTKIALYYFHERIWAWVSAGCRRISCAPVTCLVPAKEIVG